MKTCVRIAVCILLAALIQVSDANTRDLVKRDAPSTCSIIPNSKIIDAAADVFRNLTQGVLTRMSFPPCSYAFFHNAVVSCIIRKINWFKERNNREMVEFVQNKPAQMTSVAGSLFKWATGVVKRIVSVAYRVLLKQVEINKVIFAGVKRLFHLVCKVVTKVVDMFRGKEPVENLEPQGEELVSIATELYAPVVQTCSRVVVEHSQQVSFEERRRGVADLYNTYATPLASVLGLLGEKVADMVGGVSLNDVVNSKVGRMVGQVIGSVVQTVATELFKLISSLWSGSSGGGQGQGQGQQGTQVAQEE